LSPPRAAVVLTGSELVRGWIADGNGAFLARELTGLGLEPERWTVVGDRPEELEAALRDALEAELTVVSGGLGPTHDDRTVETIARLTGRPLVVDDALEREIEAIARSVAERLGRPFSDLATGVRKQASLPEGAVSLGLAGTAPALLLERDGRVVVALPGPPGELRRLWPRALEHPAVQALAARAEARGHLVVRLQGVPEAAVAEAVDRAGGEEQGLEITVCARNLEVEVDLLFRPGAEAAAERVASELERRFADALFARDERPLAAVVLDLLRERGLTIATAESCTAGLVAAALTGVPGSSEAFVGGIVAYSNAAKESLLGVPPHTIAAHGAVSAETAAAMATGARAALGADVAVAVTGIAGPGGGTPEKPVGLVHTAVAAPEGVTGARVELPGDRDEVRSRAAALALHEVRRVLTRTVADPRVFGG
jgi:nicotinamide-nucleotide amidase